MATMERRSNPFGLLFWLVGFVVVVAIAFMAMVGNMRGESYAEYQPSEQVAAVSPSTLQQQVDYNPMDLQAQLDQMVLGDDVTLDLVEGQDFVAAQRINGVLYAIDGQILQDAEVGILLPGGSFFPVPMPNREQFEHAARSRGSLLKVLLVYELVRMQPNGLYCGPSSNRCAITARAFEIGTVAVVFANNSVANAPSFGPIRTVIFQSTGVDVNQVRRSTCLTYQLYPVFGYDPQFEPIPVGTGRCFELGNIN